MSAVWPDEDAPGAMLGRRPAWWDAKLTPCDHVQEEGLGYRGAEPLAQEAGFSDSLCRLWRCETCGQVFCSYVEG